MGVFIPEDFAQVDFMTLTEGDPEEMIWSLGFNVGSAADQDGLATAASDAWNDNIAGLTSTVVDLVNVHVKYGPPDTGRVIEDSTSHAGTDGGSLLPPNSAVLVTKLTALGGRKGRGRSYLPGISEISGSLDSTGAFSGTAAANIQASYQSLIDDLQGHVNGPYTAVLLHSDEAMTPTVLTGVRCEPKIATQRRRLRP